MNRFALPIAGLVVLMGAGMGDAQAASVVRDYLLQPTANCQGALPSYEGGLHKTPLAIKNTGTAPAYVSCGFTDMSNSISDGHIYINAAFINNSTASKTVNCTLVSGLLNAELFPQVQIPKSVVVAAGDVGVIEWDATDDNGGEFFLPGLSCQLPASVELNVIEQVYTEDDAGAPV